MNDRRLQSGSMIGQAWTGKHVVLLYCYQNVFEALHMSYHAPIEPPRTNCAETLSQLLSIGYQIYAITPLTNNRFQYFLVLT